MPEQLRKELEDASLILHTGDWQSVELMEVLNDYAPLKGVFGNVDGEEIRRLFPEKLTLELEGLRIGMTHGHGKGKTTEKRAISSFKDEPIDLLIYGHSHIPVHKKIGNLVIFNPGSPTDKRRQPQYSFGILLIEGNKWSLEHIWFDRKE